MLAAQAQFVLSSSLLTLRPFPTEILDPPSDLVLYNGEKKIDKGHEENGGKF